MEETDKTYKQKVKESLWIKISSKKEEDGEDNFGITLKLGSQEECFYGGDLQSPSHIEDWENSFLGSWTEY